MDHLAYTTYRNVLNKVKLQEKKAYYSQLFVKIGKNSKMLWNVVNSLIKKANTKSSIVEIMSNGQLLNDRQSIATAFNDHFVNAGRKVHNTIPTNLKSPEQCNTKTYSPLKFKKVTEMEICKIVARMHAKTSNGPDGMSNHLLKSLVNVIKYPLCIIFNKSLSLGIFPDLLKLARVIPLFKTGDPQDLDNYWPISLLPVISKVLEQIVYRQLTEHLEINQIQYPHQYGFRKQHSTTDAVLKLVGEMLRSFEKDQMVLSVFIDLRKAFDTISHSLVYKKLQCIGVTNVELEWFKSYMTSHNQYMDIDGACSQKQGCDIGIAQSSLLGVIIFQLFINDLSKCLKYTMSILYADDTTIYLVGNSLRFLKLKMQADLNNLCM